MVYATKDDQGKLEYLALPIRGYGLWSMMSGYLSLKGDLNTIEGVVFTDHGETPGLGAEITNPRWVGQFKGKKLYDDNGNYILVVRHKSGQIKNPDQDVDGISGATLTTSGVDNLMRFWFDSQTLGVYKLFLTHGQEILSSL